MMQYRILLIIFLVTAIQVRLPGQHSGSVTRLPFCSGLEDEFAPVYYQNGLIFCSDRRDNSLVGFTSGDSRMYNIFQVQKTRSGQWSKPVLLADELVSGMNDGPACFCEADSTLYFSRNHEVSRSLRNITDTLNKLGIYMTRRIGGSWLPAIPFPYNEKQANLTTPSVAADGSRIYFASDKPGGFGGLDLYYSERSNGQWKAPVNLGNRVNTPLNETFPFAAAHGKLYFSSDGHPGRGGQDLFYTLETDGRWIAPVHLDSAINSEADDFGLVTDAFRNGFFSSNRLKTDDIYSFTISAPSFPDCDTMKENRYCFTFYDERQVAADTLPVEYRWDFGDGRIRTGIEAGYCFPGPGTYVVKLRIVNTMTGKDVADEAEYIVHLEQIQQGYIHAPDMVTAGHVVALDGSRSFTGDAGVSEYYWDFGDGFATGGASMKKTFDKKGVYVIQMGLALSSEGEDSLQYVCVKKNIRVLEKEPEVLFRPEYGVVPGDGVPDSKGNTNFSLVILSVDELSGSQRQHLKEALYQQERMGMTFLDFAVSPASMPGLISLADWLKALPGWNVDVMVQAVRSNGSESLRESERYARSVGFALKELGVNIATIRCNGFAPDAISALYTNREAQLRNTMVWVLSKPAFK